MKLPSMIKGWLNTTTTPERLLENYVSTGEKENVTKLVELFNLSLFHYLMSLSDKETAEDIIQTMWVKVLKINSPNKKHTNVKSLLYTMARNTLYDELRRQQKWKYIEFEENLIEASTLSETLEKNSRLEMFNLAIKQLPFYQREVFIFQQEGFSVLEICELTNENFETVKSRLRYARNNLKSLLGNHHE